MAKVLVIEADVNPHVAATFIEDGFTVMTAVYLDEVMASIATFAPDAVVIELPRVDSGSIRLCATLRAATKVPLMVVSSRTRESDVVAVYAAGVDAFTDDSARSHELVSRVRALIRRSPAHNVVVAEVLVVGPIVLDRASRELRVDGRRVVMPRREFDIAELLMRNAGRVVHRGEIVRELWGSARDTKSLDVQVGRLRAKLTEAEGWQRIVTVRGVGFRFATQDEAPDLVSEGRVIDLRPDIDLVADQEELTAGSSSA